MRMLFFLLIFFPLPSYASGMGATGLSSYTLQCTSVVAGAGASPQTATCAAGYWLTGLGCADAVAADVSAPTTITTGLGGAVTCTSNAGNVTATAICCK